MRTTGVWPVGLVTMQKYFEALRGGEGNGKCEPGAYITWQVLPVYPREMRNHENVSLSKDYRFQSCLGINQLKECHELH